MRVSRRTTPQRVGALLTAAVPELAHRMLDDRIRKEWALAVGGDLAERSQPAELRQGELRVLVDNSPWLQELTMRSGEILGALQNRYGPSVTSLRFSLGEWPRLTSTVAQRRRRAATPRLTPEEARLIEAATGGLQDGELAAALRRLLAKAELARRQRRSSARNKPSEPGPEGPAGAEEGEA